MPGEGAVDREGCLRKLPLLAGVGEDTIAALARAATLRTVGKGAPLFCQGDAADTFYVLLSGAVILLVGSADGHELAINEMRPGDCFGELALLTNEPRSTGATALIPSTVLAVPRSAFLAAVSAEPALTLRLLQITAGRLSQSSEREAALAFMDAEARLARVLLALDEQQSDKGYVTISQEELAQRTGLTRQTVASTLGRWRRRGWLVTGRGRIMVLNQRALQRE